MVDLVRMNVKGLRPCFQPKLNTVFDSVSIDSSGEDGSNVYFGFWVIRLLVAPSTYA